MEFTITGICPSEPRFPWEITSFQLKITSLPVIRRESLVFEAESTSRNYEFTVEKLGYFNRETGIFQSRNWDISIEKLGYFSREHRT